MIQCEYFPQCTGCAHWGKPYEIQSQLKIQHLKHILNAKNITFTEAIEFISAGESGLRNRCDFTIEFNENKKKHLIGFYNLSKEIIHINRCLQFSPELQKVYDEFIQFSFYYGSKPLKKGSVRLRISPDGQKGCWLDFSNFEIKQFLEDKTLLEALLNAGFIVEVGQKGKKLVKENNQLKLKEPEPHVWFQTQDFKNQDLPLRCLISDFTQPSWKSAKKITDTVKHWIEQYDIKGDVLEFGPGIGQFSVSFLSHNLALTCCEINESSATQLINNVSALGLSKNFTLKIGDFHKRSLESHGPYELAFVNPARSGLRNFTDEIIKSKANYVIYVSCFPISFVDDFINLSSSYKLCNIKIIDQFPQTEHYEICCLMEKLS